MMNSVLDLIPQTERETLKFRLLGVLGVGLAFIPPIRDGEVPLISTFALIGGYLAYSYILRTLLIPRFASYQLLGVMLLIDVGTIVAALYLVGLDSPIFGLLPIVVVYYSVHLGYIGGVSTATAATIGYTLLALTTNQVSDVQNLLASQPFFYVLALLVGYVTQQRFQESQERQSLQQLIGAEAHAKNLLDLAQALNKVMDPASVSNDIANMGALVARLPVSVVFMYDSERKALVCQGSNLPPGTLSQSGDEPLYLDVEAGAFGADVWSGTKSPPSEEVGTESGQMPPWLVKANVLRAVAVPLRNNGQKVGVLCVGALDSAEAFGADTIKSVESFSEAAGRILANTQMYTVAERRSRRVANELQQSIEATGRIRDLTQRKVLRFGPLVIEPLRETLRWQDTNLRLTKNEFDLLYALADNSGTVVNAETLTRDVWGPDFVAQGNVVDVTIHRLRRKLAGIPEGRKLIKTVRGQGYTFVPP